MIQLRHSMWPQYTTRHCEPPPTSLDNGKPYLHRKIVHKTTNHCETMSSEVSSHLQEAHNLLISMTLSGHYFQKIVLHFAWVDEALHNVLFLNKPCCVFYYFQFMFWKLLYTNKKFIISWIRGCCVPSLTEQPKYILGIDVIFYKKKYFVWR